MSQHCPVDYADIIGSSLNIPIHDGIWHCNSNNYLLYRWQYKKSWKSCTIFLPIKVKMHQLHIFWYFHLNSSVRACLLFHVSREKMKNEKHQTSSTEYQENVLQAPSQLEFLYTLIKQPTFSHSLHFKLTIVRVLKASFMIVAQRKPYFKPQQ